MRILKLLGLALVVFTIATSCIEESDFASQSDVLVKERSSFAYQLNIIGVPKDKTADMDNNNGHRIFVQLNGGETVNGNGKGGKWKPGQNWDDLDKVNKILLQEGDFGVLDANATDDDGALFQLPDPNPADGDPPAYWITARALGIPGGHVEITTCADEEGDGFDGSDDVWCGSNSVVIEGHGNGNNGNKGGGKPVVVEVTENLLKMTINIDPDDDPDLAACLGFEDTPDVNDPVEEVDVWLFDPCFENYFWNYDNSGLKLLQLRFWEIEPEV